MRNVGCLSIIPLKEVDVILADLLKHADYCGIEEECILGALSDFMSEIYCTNRGNFISEVDLLPGSRVISRLNMIYFNEEFPEELIRRELLNFHQQYQRLTFHALQRARDSNLRPTYIEFNNDHTSEELAMLVLCD